MYTCHLIDGWSMSDVASALDRSLNTVRSQGEARPGEAHGNRPAAKALHTSSAGLAGVALVGVAHPVPGPSAGPGAARAGRGGGRLARRPWRPPLVAALLGVAVMAVTITAGLTLVGGDGPGPGGHASTRAALRRRASPSGAADPRPQPLLGIDALLQVHADGLLASPRPHGGTGDAHNRRLTPGTFLPCDYPSDFASYGSPCSRAWRHLLDRSPGAAAARAIIDAIATQCDLTWRRCCTSRWSSCAASRPLSARAWEALVATVRAPASTALGSHQGHQRHARR